MHKVLSIILIAALSITPAYAQKKRYLPVNEVEQTLAQGLRTYILSDYKGAMRNFEAVINGTPAGNDASADAAMRSAHCRALFGMGLVWNFLDNPDRKKAAEYYRLAADQGGRTDEAAWALLALARLKHVVGINEEPDFPAIRAAYQNVIDAFPVHPAAEEAIIYQQETYLVSWKKDDAIIAEKALVNYVKNYPDPHHLRLAYTCLGFVYKMLDNPQKRMEVSLAHLKLIEGDVVNPINKDLSPAIWQIADIAEWGLGDFVTARNYYNRLIREYPLDMRVFAAKIALKRMDEMEGKKR
ncbi:MAG: tetratricopeptide repeat protein [Spirochaetes bacterium]|nr:tetratricopeptide repeat protein [Spirochaetota bacterium]